MVDIYTTRYSRNTVPLYRKVIMLSESSLFLIKSKSNKYESVSKYIRINIHFLCGLQ